MKMEFPMSLKNTFYKAAPFAGGGFLYLIFYMIGVGCPIYYLTGIPCAGCGLTRAYESLIQGDFTLAFTYHLLFLLPPLFFLWYLLKRRLGDKIYRGGIFIFVFLFLVVYLFRLIQSNPVNEIQIKEGKIYQLVHYIFRNSL